MVSPVKRFGAADSIISIKNHLKGDFRFNGLLDLVCLFIDEIWHDVQKRSGYILSAISSQTLEVYSSINDLMDL